MQAEIKQKRQIQTHFILKYSAINKIITMTLVKKMLLVKASLLKLSQLLHIQIEVPLRQVSFLGGHLGNTLEPFVSC